MKSYVNIKEISKIFNKPSTHKKFKLEILDNLEIREEDENLRTLYEYGYFILVNKIRTDKFVKVVNLRNKVGMINKIKKEITEIINLNLNTNKNLNINSNNTNNLDNKNTNINSNLNNKFIEDKIIVNLFNSYKK